MFPENCCKSQTATATPAEPGELPWTLVLLLLAFLLYAPLSASPARADRVDDCVREQMRLRHVPGLALAVVRDGRVIKESGSCRGAIRVCLLYTSDAADE